VFQLRRPKNPDNVTRDNWTSPRHTYRMKGGQNYPLIKYYSP